MTPEYDLLIIGGGINGCGIARDAAGRGLKVLLVEMDDLAAATSSKSTKLIHGGLRYLEYFDFPLVRKALKEREILLKAAPHIIRPLKFILPHEPHLRPKWMIRLGLFLYDHLATRETLGGSRQIRLDRNDPANPLHSRFTDGFSYFDCMVDDARLVVLTALDARERGARILTRTKFIAAHNKGDHWQVEIAPGGRVTAKMLINAAGPWVSDIIRDRLALKSHNRLRLVKGSHIIVPKLYPGDDAYILQNKDGRIIFAIPYQQHYSLIGTTDIPYDGDPAQVSISPAEIDYLCQHIDIYFRPTLSHGRPLSAADVISDYAGVRPLYDDATHEASAVTRDFVLALGKDDGAPLLSVFGGKITTFRHLAEKALERLSEFFPDMAAPWTATVQLPGGDIADMAQFIQAKQAEYPDLDKNLCRRYAGLYGSRMDEMLRGRRADSRLVGPELYDYEADYLMRQEWAQTAEDILWRRTKLGLLWSEAEVKQLEGWLKDHHI